MHWPGIGPGSPAWQASILPLNHQCLILIPLDLSNILTFHESVRNIRQKFHRSSNESPHAVGGKDWKSTKTMCTLGRGRAGFVLIFCRIRVQKNNMDPQLSSAYWWFDSRMLASHVGEPSLFILFEKTISFVKQYSLLV